MSDPIEKARCEIRFARKAGYCDSPDWNSGVFLLHTDKRSVLTLIAGFEALDKQPEAALAVVEAAWEVVKCPTSHNIAMLSKTFTDNKMLPPFKAKEPGDE